MATMKSPSLMPPYSANELLSTNATITGASPRTENPNPSTCFPRCNWINRGAVQYLLAEKIATGPRALNKSFTL